MSRDPWDERRLEAAFRARAATVRTPSDLVDATVGPVRVADPPRPAWRRWLPAAAVVLLAVGVVAGGIAMSGDKVGRDLFRPGPTADLRTFDTGEFAFDYPAGWLGYDASAAFSGGSAIAVIGTQPVESRCGSERHVDINCVYEQRLEEGQVRLHVGTGTYRGGTIEDRPDRENATTTRLVVGGMPAILDEFDRQPDSYYRDDVSLHWEIALPGTSGRNVVRLEAMIREPGVAEARRQLEALVASFRFTKGPDPSAPPTPEPTPTETPTSLRELREMTVEELIAAMAAPTPEEVVVRGWLTRTSAIADCNVESDPHPLVPFCEDFGLTLTGARLTTDRGFSAPSIPHVVPMLGADAQSEVSTLPGTGIEVEAIGHLADHRWTTCPEERQAECRSRFVIDRVYAAGQPFLDLQPWAIPTDLPTDQPDDAIEVVSSIVGGVTVVSIGVADANGVRSVEPLVQEINNEEGAWVIRALVAGDSVPIARTFLVGHVGFWTLFEVTESGVVDRIAQPDSSWPPEGVLDVPMPEGNTGLTPKAGVVDRTGLLVEARAAPRGPSSSVSRGEMSLVQLTPDTIAAHWDGTCGDRFVLTLHGDGPGRPPDGLVVRGFRATRCRQPQAHDGIVLRLSRPVDAAAIQALDQAGTPHEAFPPVDSTVVALAKDGGFERPTIEVAIVDLSRRVTGVRAPRKGEPRAIDQSAHRSVLLLPDPVQPGRYHLYWTGSVCDDEIVVTIDATIMTVSVDGGRRQACDAMGVERRLIIDVDGALDPSAVETTYTETVIGAS